MPLDQAKQHDRYKLRQTQEDQEMKVKDIMTKNVVTVKPDASVCEAAGLMQKYNIGAVPVCDHNGVVRIVGIVTDRDIVVRNVAAGSDPKSTPVSSIMTTNVITVSPETDVEEVGAIMSGKQIRRVPVVDNDSLVGIVALGDLAVDTRVDSKASAALTEISRPVK